MGALLPDTMLQESAAHHVLLMWVLGLIVGRLSEQLRRAEGAAYLT